MHSYAQVLAPVKETVRVCSEAELAPGQRMVVAVGGRNILLTNHVNGQLYACDNACYHHGMPLQGGECRR
jgi:nitrite reductase/ring-hydroxylating ferredoxin subunit